MNELNYVDAAVIVGALLIAVASLTKLMLARRDRVIAEVQQQLTAEGKRRKAEAKKKKKQQAA